MASKVTSGSAVWSMIISVNWDDGRQMEGMGCKVPRR